MCTCTIMQINDEVYETWSEWEVEEEAALGGTQRLELPRVNRSVHHQTSEGIRASLFPLSRDKLVYILLILGFG